MERRNEADTFDPQKPSPRIQPLWTLALFPGYTDPHGPHKHHVYPISWPQAARALQFKPVPKYLHSLLRGGIPSLSQGGSFAQVRVRPHLDWLARDILGFSSNQGSQVSLTGGHPTTLPSTTLRASADVFPIIVPGYAACVDCTCTYPEAIPVQAHPSKLRDL